MIEDISQQAAALEAAADDLMMRVLVMDERLRRIESAMEGVKEFLKQRGSL